MSQWKRRGVYSLSATPKEADEDIVLTIGSTSNWNIFVAIAQRQVLGAQAQVEQSAAQLRRDQVRLDTEKRNLAFTQQAAQRAAQIETAQAQKTGLNVLAEKVLAEPQSSATTETTTTAQPASSQTGTTQPQVNAEGQTIGQVINVAA